MLPYTLHHPLEQYRSSVAEQNWSKAMNYMLDFFEAGVQYMAIVLMGMLREEIVQGRQTPHPNLVKVAVKIDTKRPLSFGDWCNDILPVVASLAAQQLPDSAIAHAMAEITGKKRNVFLGGKNTLSVVQVRNEYKGHSTTLSAQIYRGVVEQLADRLEVFVAALAAMDGYAAEESLYPLVHKDALGHDYVFQSLKDESVSFISVCEDAITYVGEAYNADFDAWMQAILPSFDIRKLMNWYEYTALACQTSSEYIQRIYSQKKYNREMFVEREALAEAYDRFVHSNSILFPLPGQAGQGKTNQLCHWTEMLQEQGEAVMIFAGSDFADKTLASTLKTIFGLSERKDIRILIDRMHDEAVKSNRYLYVFFDAINECLTYPSEGEDESALKLFKDIVELFGDPRYTHFKVLLTCRTFTWHRVMTPALKYMDTSVFYTLGEDDGPAVGGFTDSEVEKAYAIYEDLFQMDTAFEALRRKCVIRLKDPLVLKMACTNYLGQAMPEDSTPYCSVYLFRKMMADIASSYAGRKQHEILRRMGMVMLEAYEAGRAVDTLYVDELQAAYNQEGNTLHALAHLIYKEDGTTIAFNELLNKPERPVLRLVDGKKIQFIYERFLEYVLAETYFCRETSGLGSDQCISVDRLRYTLHHAAVNEVFLRAIATAIIMDYLRTGRADTIISLCRDYGDDFDIISVVNDTMNTLVEENYETQLFDVERALLTHSDAETDQIIERYNQVCAKISGNKADAQVIADHKVLSAQVNPTIRLRELASLTLIRGIFLSDYHREGLYVEDPYTLLWLLMTEKISEVKDSACMYIYYNFKKNPDITRAMTTRMLTEVTSGRLLSQFVSAENRRRTITLMEAGVRLEVLLMIDYLLGGHTQDRAQVSEIIQDIKKVFAHVTGNFTLVRLIMPFFSWIMRRQLTFQSAYVNNVIEYQTFWDPTIVVKQPDEKGSWSREDLRRTAALLNYYSTYFAEGAPLPATQAPDFHNLGERLQKAYLTADSFSYFVIERVLVVLAVSDWKRVEPILQQLRNCGLEKTPWFDYTQMSIIYTLYQMGMKMPELPALVEEMLEQWCVDWTRRCRGYFKARNSHRANSLQLYKRNVMTWYAKVWAQQHGDLREESTMAVPAFRMLIEEAVAERDKEMLVHLINNISELVTDGGNIYTALNLLKLVFERIDSQIVLDELEQNASLRYPDTAEDIVSLIGKILGTAKNYFPDQVNQFLKKDVRGLSFPGLPKYRDEILGFNPGGEKLSDLFTHQFGNFVIWALINEKVVDDVAIEILNQAGPAPDCFSWFDTTIRITFKHLFDIKI